MYERVYSVCMDHPGALVVGSVPRNNEFGCVYSVSLGEFERGRGLEVCLVRA